MQRTLFTLSAGSQPMSQAWTTRLSGRAACMVRVMVTSFARFAKCTLLNLIQYLTSQACMV